MASTGASIGRRSTFRLLAGSALASLAAPAIVQAATKSVTIGVDLSLTGADADTANLIKDGFLMAIDEANAKGGPAGVHINVLMLDDGTATAGQYDPAQGATNARKMVADFDLRRGAGADEQHARQGDGGDLQPG